MWHIDTTVIGLPDRTRAYLHAVIDDHNRPRNQMVACACFYSSGLLRSSEPKLLHSRAPNDEFVNPSRIPW
jgi:hypothetical protein